MPETWETNPTLSALVAQSGVADAAGNINLDPNVDGAGTSIDGRLSDFILYGIFNGAFSRGPVVDPTGWIDPINNPLPDWNGPTQVSGGAVQCSWVADASSPSGYNLRFTMNPGAASDEAYVETIIPIGGSRMRWTSAKVQASVLSVSSTNYTGMRPYVKDDFLDAAGNVVAPGSTALGLFSADGQVKMVGVLSANPDSSIGNAVRQRIRLGVLRTGAATDTAVYDFADVRATRANTGLILPDLDGTGTYLSTTLYQSSNVATLDFGDSAGNGVFQVFGVVQVHEHLVGSPATPPTGYYSIYAKAADSHLYGMNDAGVETQLDSGGVASTTSRAFAFFAS